MKSKGRSVKTKAPPKEFSTSLANGAKPESDDEDSWMQQDSGITLDTEVQNPKGEGYCYGKRLQAHTLFVKGIKCPRFEILAQCYPLIFLILL